MLTVKQLLSFLLFSILSFSVHADIQMIKGTVKAVPAGEETAPAYVTLKNDDRSPVFLVSASSKDAYKVDLQEAQDSDGAIFMNSVDKIFIHASRVTAINGRRQQLLLLGPKKSLSTGETVHLSLSFSNGQTIETELAVTK